MRWRATNCSEFIRNNRGATAVEYGLIIALISIAALVAMSAFSDNLIRLFDKAGSTMYNAVP